MDTNTRNAIQPMALQQLKENANWFLGLGIGLVVLGTFGLIFSFAFTLASVVYLGFFLILAGLFEATKAFKINHWGYFLLHILLSILYGAAGIYMIVRPGINALSLTIFLAVFLLISGIMRIFFALTHQVPHKSWLILNGALSMLLGGLIWYQWPLSGLWVIGTLVAIEFIFTGWTWIMLGLKAKRLEPNRTNNV